MKFCLVNLGCKVNKVESDDAAAFLLAQGWRFTDKGDAELVVVNTCTVTGEADKKTRKAVRHALSANPGARVLVTGCASAIHPRFYEELDTRVSVVPKAYLMKALQEEASAYGDVFPIESVGGPSSLVLSDAMASVSASSDASIALRLGEGFRTRVGVKVQDGCDNSCTYCIVHVARGKATSRPFDEVIRECVAYAKAGVKEIVLSGINIGSYRYDAGRCERPILLPGLLHALLLATADVDGPLPRFRISSIEPCDVSDDLIEVMACSEGRICRHLHIPLQAGSEKVLKEMARPYGPYEFIELVRKLRNAMPYISLSTDIIVGFPGETRDEFEETLALAQMCGFSRIHVFPYSRREGTPAAERLDQVAPEEKSARAAQLRSLAVALRKKDRAAREGSIEWCLVESKGVAVSESYHEVLVPQEAVQGSLVEIAL